MENIYKRVPEASEYMTIQLMDKSPHTITTYETALNRFFEFMNIQSLDDLKKIVPLNCRNFQAKEQKNGLQASSINSLTRPLKAFMNWLLENEYIQVNPFMKVKELRVGKRMSPFFTEKEISDFLTACTKIEEKCMFSILFATAIRREELVNIKLTDIVGYTFKIIGKGNKERRVFLLEEYYQLLLKYIEWRNKKYGTEIPYLFVSKMRRQYAGESIRLKIKSIMARANFPPERIAELHTHSTRHTAVANYEESGIDIKVAQVILGHANLSTTANLYAHVRDSRIEAAMRNQKSYL